MISLHNLSKGYKLKNYKAGENFATRYSKTDIYETFIFNYQKELKPL